MVKLIKEETNWRSRNNVEMVRNNIDILMDSLYKEEHDYLNLSSVIEDLESIYGRISGISNVYNLDYDDVEGIKDFLFTVITRKNGMEDSELIKENYLETRSRLGHYPDYPEVTLEFADAFIEGREESRLEEMSHLLTINNDFIKDLLFEYARAYNQNLSREQLLSNILINAYELENEKDIRPKLYEYYSQFIV